MSANILRKEEASIAKKEVTDRWKPDRAAFEAGNLGFGKLALLKDATTVAAAMEITDTEILKILARVAFACVGNPDRKPPAPPFPAITPLF
jgi:hypothetical protein